MAEQITGTCRGGPLDGHTITVPGPKFVAADKAANKAWLYQSTGTRFLICTDHDSALIYPEGPVSGERHLDWNRLDTTDLPVVSLGDTPEALAGGPVDDGWDAPPPPPPPA